METYYPKGYQISNGEERYYHVMFVDVLKTKGPRSVDRAVFQKYFPKEWAVMERNIKDLGILVTGHHEYAVIHDPVEYAEAQAEAKRVEKEKAEAIEKARLAKEAKAKEVKPEPEPAKPVAGRSKAPQKE